MHVVKTSEVQWHSNFLCPVLMRRYCLVFSLLFWLLVSNYLWLNAWMFFLHDKWPVSEARFCGEHLTQVGILYSRSRESFKASTVVASSFSVEKHFPAI